MGKIIKSEWRGGGGGGGGGGESKFIEEYTPLILLYTFIQYKNNPCVIF